MHKIYELVSGLRNGIVVISEIVDNKTMFKYLTLSPSLIEILNPNENLEELSSEYYNSFYFNSNCVNTCIHAYDIINNKAVEIRPHYIKGSCAIVCNINDETLNKDNLLMKTLYDELNDDEDDIVDNYDDFNKLILHSVGFCCMSEVDGVFFINKDKMNTEFQDKFFTIEASMYIDMLSKSKNNKIIIN